MSSVRVSLFFSAKYMYSYDVIPCTRYPNVVDKALEDVFASLPDNGDEDKGKGHSKRRKTKGDQSTKTDWLHCFISLALPQSRHQLLGDGSGTSSTTLALSVHHHSPSVRAAAVKRLGRSLLNSDQVCAHSIGTLVC